MATDNKIVVFNEQVLNVNDLKKYDRASDKYMTVALLLSAYKTWTPDNESDCEEIMKALMNSPTVKDSYSAHTKQFVKDRMMQNNKYNYIANSYFKGATVENGYKPSEPLTLEFQEFPYAPQKSNMYGVTLTIDKVMVKSAGADSVRSVSVYKDPEDDNWYIWSDTYGGLLTDVRSPK